jgi:hypothetical protein
MINLQRWGEQGLCPYDFLSVTYPSGFAPDVEKKPKRTYFSNVECMCLKNNDITL